MGLVFRPKIQGGTAIVKNSLGCLADDVIFGSVHFGEGIIQELQLLDHETCSVMGDACKIQGILLTSVGILAGQGTVGDPSSVNSFPEVTLNTTLFTAMFMSLSSSFPPLWARSSVYSHSMGPAQWVRQLPGQDYQCQDQGEGCQCPQTHLGLP